MTMKLFAVTIFAALCNELTAQMYELTVPKTATTGVGGEMFDVKAGPMDVTISQIMFMFNGGRDDQSYKMWYKKGSLAGYNTDESAWTLACSASTNIQWDGSKMIYTNTGTGDFNAITDSSQCAFKIPAGETYSIYIHGISRSLSIFDEGTSLTEGAAKSEYLTVYTGLGVASSKGPFGSGYGDDYFKKPRVSVIYGVREEEGNECSLDVLSIDHKSRVNGRYFNFDKEVLDKILGRSDWSGETLAIDNGRDVMVWRNPNGGSKGDAHGRLNPKLLAKANDWSVGDRVTISECVGQSMCGENQCGIGEYCCDPFCGTCAPNGWGCTQGCADKDIKAKKGEICREGGVETGFLFERECEKGLECLPKPGVVAIGGEVPHICQSFLAW